MAFTEFSSFMAPTASDGAESAAKLSPRGLSRNSRHSWLRQRPTEPRAQLYSHTAAITEMAFTEFSSFMAPTVSDGAESAAKLSPRGLSRNSRHSWLPTASDGAESAAKFSYGGHHGNGFYGILVIHGSDSVRRSRERS